MLKGKTIIAIGAASGIEDLDISRLSVHTLTS